MIIHSFGVILRYLILRKRVKYEDWQFNPALRWLAGWRSVEVNTTLNLLVAVAQALIARQYGGTCNKAELCPCFGAARNSGDENQW